MQKLGINKTSKTDSVTKIFEYLTSEVLKEKYPYLLDVIVCALGKLKVSDYVYNGTRQPYFDMLVVIEDSHGNILHLGFDHKVKEFESCIKDIQHHGFKYSIFTLGDVEDRVFYESPKVTEQLKNHNYSQVYNDDAINSNIASKIALSKTGSVTATKNLNNNNELVKKVVENITEFERTKDVNVMIRTSLIPVMLCNSKDLAKVVAELNAKRKTPGFGVDFSDVDNYN